MCALLQVYDLFSGACLFITNHGFLMLLTFGVLLHFPLLLEPTFRTVCCVHHQGRHHWLMLLDASRLFDMLAQDGRKTRDRVTPQNTREIILQFWILDYNIFSFDLHGRARTSSPFSSLFSQWQFHITLYICYTN